MDHAEPAADHLLRAVLVDAQRIPIASEHVDNALAGFSGIDRAQPVGTRVGAVL
ncbi:MAG: hypothetical protein Q8L45_01735 [Xanthomonadaceae bacterium]|nr:hypothetical protein [Xanthomonadaceae bacterium]MDP2185018.1 hypothetical protein [Xanthomonadales bacterium]MDZ4114397.1 hypothetical protein [Xanthomonadaceae bacterium]